MNYEELLAQLAEMGNLIDKTAEQQAEYTALKIKVDAMGVENARQAGIYAVCAEMKVGDTVRATFIGDTTKDAQALKDKLYADMQQGNVHLAVKVGEDNKDTLVASMGQAMALQAGLKIENPSDMAKKYASASYLDIASRIIGDDAPVGRIELSQMAMSTDILTTLLVETGRRTLVQEPDEVATTYAQIMGLKVTPDFKIGKDVRISGLGLLKPHKEGGEAQNKELSEEFQSYAIKTFTGQVNFTREMLYNDDLGSFFEAMKDVGRSADRTMDALAYDLLTAGDRVLDLSTYKMSDGLPIFHADHGNLMSTTLSDSSLTAARKMMATQKKLDGSTAYIVPQTLVVGEALRATASRLLYSTASIQDNKNAGVYNPHLNSLKLVVSHLIDDDSWFLLDGANGMNRLELQGTGGKPITTIIQESALKKTIEIVYDAGAYAKDYRGMLKGK